MMIMLFLQVVLFNLEKMRRSKTYMEEAKLDKMVTITSMIISMIISMTILMIISMITSMIISTYDYTNDLLHGLLHDLLHDHLIGHLHDLLHDLLHDHPIGHLHDLIRLICLRASFRLQTGGSVTKSGSLSLDGNTQTW